MQDRRRSWLGGVSLIFINIIWSGTFSATAIALERMSAVFLALVRLGCGALVLAPFLRLPEGRRWTWRIAGFAAALGAIGFTAPFCLEAFGLHLSSPAVAAMSIALEPLFTAVLAAIIAREPMPPRRIAALCLAFLGAWIIAGCPRPGAAGHWLGNVLLLLAVVCYGVYNALSPRLIDSVPPSAATAAALMSGFLTTLPVWWLTGARLPEHLAAPQWVALLYLALFGTALANLIWMLILQSFHVAWAALFLYIQPILGVVLAVFIAGTHPSWPFYPGAACILGALVLGRGNAQRVTTNISAAHPAHPGTSSG